MKLGKESEIFLERAVHIVLGRGAFLQEVMVYESIKLSPVLEW